MSQLVEKQLFYKALNDLSIPTNDLGEKRSEIKEIVFMFNQSLQGLTPDKKLIKRNKDLGQLLTTTIDQIKEAGNSWVDNYQEMEARDKFRSDLASYFIIIIFGKVKAGKSSLGNFIAKQKLLTQDVSFFKYDEAGKEVAANELEEIDPDGFATNNLECTAEIQGFKLGRLAWIDTPGLGSMTKENGDLAKEYIQAADYIIYPTSSDSPLQQDETSQLKELFAQNKKVTICITKSDNTEEDECECGSENGCENCEGGLLKILVNKGAKNRQNQEGWVKDEIRKIIPKNKKESLLGDVFSISVHTAKQGLTHNNKKSYKNSNLPVFYEQVTDVLNNKAAGLKNSTPYDGLKAFIDKDILGLEGEGINSIKVIKNSLNDLDGQIKESLQRFDELKKNTQNDVHSIVDQVLTMYSSEIDQANFKEKISHIDKEIESKISQDLQKNISEIFCDFEASLDHFTGALDNREFEIKDKFKEVSYTTKTVRKKVGRSLFAVVATISVGLLTGGSSLVVQGFAATTAALAASYVGEKAGEALGSNEITKVNIGDNKEEVLQQFKANRQEHYVESINTAYQQFQDDFFAPLKGVSNTISTDIKSFEQKLERFKEKLC